MNAKTNQVLLQALPTKELGLSSFRKLPAIDN
jgi:hypothetical protein